MKKMDSLREEGVRLYVSFMLLVFPLFYKNGYYDILRAKRSVYLNMTGLFLIFVLCTVIVDISQKRVGMQKIQIKKRILWLVYMTLVLTISTMLSDNRADSWWGLSGRYLGSVLLILGCITVVVIEKYLIWEPYMTGLFLAGASGVYILQILNEWKIDPLHMGVAKEENAAGYFTGTFGNLNFNAQFNVMSLAVVMTLFLLSENRKLGILYKIVLILGLWGSICCRSDSVLFGVFVIVLILLIYCLKTKRSWENMSEIFGCIFIANLLMVICYSHFSEKVFAVAGAMKILLQKQTLMIELLLYVVSQLGIRNHVMNQTIKNHKRKVIVVMLSAVFAFCLWQFKKWNGIEAAAMIQEWANGREYIWKRSWEMFRGFSWREKLFGCGTNRFGDRIYADYGEEMMSLFGMRYIDAHNEYLHFLVTTGIFGVLGYFGGILSVLIRSIHICAGNKNALIAITGGCAFLVAAMCNGPQPATTPLLFVELGIFSAIIRKKELSEN